MTALFAKAAASANPAPLRGDRQLTKMLVLLTCINMLNYLDRFVVAAMLPVMQADMHLSDTQAGLVGSAFMVVYLVVCPLFGYVGDRARRPRWLAAGVAVWSVATALSGMASRLTGLLAARGLVGVGEAAYGAMAPALLADASPPDRRGRLLAYFYMATPVGSALGYLLGGLLAERLGWRHAFFVVGPPGLLLAALALRLPDRRPQPQAASIATATATATAKAPPRWRTLASSRLYVLTVAGYTACTFSTGALAFWLPTYLVRERHFAMEQGMLVCGGITVATGLLGTLLGGAWGDALLRRTPHGYSVLNAASALGAALFGTAALLCSGTATFIVLLILTQLSLFLSSGPVNALILSTVPPALRATAMATSIFFIHVLGDSYSPALVGRLSDGSNLRSAMLAVPGGYLLGALIWASALRCAPPQERA